METKKKAGASATGGGAAATSAPAAAKDYYVSDLSPDEKFALARSVGEECIQEEELRLLLSKKPHPVVYDGFEPSGRMHIAQGVLRSINVNKLTRCGCVFKVRHHSLSRLCALRAVVTTMRVVAGYGRSSG